MVDRTQLDTMRQSDIEHMDRSLLVDIQDVKIDAALSAPERMRAYLEQIKNPYCFLCADVPVRLCFSPDAAELKALLKLHFTSLR